MNVRLTWTDCDEAGDYVVSNVLSPKDLVSKPDNMDEAVPHTDKHRLIEVTWCKQIITSHFPIRILVSIHDV